MKRALRIIGIILLVLIVLLAIGAAFVYAQSESIINRRYEATVPELTIPEATDELIEEGRRIFVTRGCSSCHMQDGSGQYMINEPIFGVLAAPNLTHGAGGRPADYTAEDYMRAIMYGIGGDGRGLAIMPSENYSQWREDELVPLLVYLTNMPSVDNELSAPNYGLIGRALLSFGAFPISAELVDRENAGIISLEAAPTVEYGQYLSLICASCHGANFAGAPSPDGAGLNSANLTPSDSGIGTWTLEDFMTALRTGSRPDGTVLDPVEMPWPSFALMTDVEIEALYNYLHSLEPIENEN